MKSSSIKSFSIFRNKEIEGRPFPKLAPLFNMKTLKLSGKDDYKEDFINSYTEI